MLEMLKNGSGIHIKKKNRGSFTKWCGGNVTDECIKRGKNSSNPKIRKKATFADNARKWKHADGGILKCLKGSPWLSKEKQAYNDRLMSKKGSFMVDSIYNRNIDPIKGAGVAGSMALESSFNPNARGGSHLGYVQNEPRIVNYIKRNYGGYDHNAQIRFLLDGLTKGLPDSTSVIGRDLLTRFNNYNWKTYKTPEEAARAWEKSYEKSGGLGNNQRLYYSRMFYNLINNKLRGHKKGGSLSKKPKGAFVPGVSITDSNPKAYKYVKKKYGIKKAELGATLGLKIGNFLNSDLGKASIQVGSQLLGLIPQNKQNAKINSELLKWKESYVNSINPPDFSDTILLHLYLTKDPDTNISSTVVSYVNNILRNKYLPEARWKASQEADERIMNFNLQNLSKDKSFDYGNMISTILLNIPSKNGNPVSTSEAYQPLSVFNNLYLIYTPGLYSIEAPYLPQTWKLTI